MQMYRVKFARKLNDAEVDVGDVVVCATSQEVALISVAEILALPVSDTEFEVARVKPSFFQIARRRVNNKMATFDAAMVDNKLACRATFPGVTERLAARDWYQLHVQADINAENDNEAVMMLSRAIAREMNGEKQRRSLRNLDITCDRRSLHPRTAAVDENALFTFRRIFQGGDTRT